MPNHNILSDMEFEQHLTEMGDNQIELIKFVARQQFTMSTLCPIHSKRIEKLENRTKKELGITNSISAAFGVAIASALDFFLRR